MAWRMVSGGRAEYARAGPWPEASERLAQVRSAAAPHPPRLPTHATPLTVRTNDTVELARVRHELCL
eukprot:scaffold19363_cov103-Isochrysis_galbana.AAC.3